MNIFLKALGCRLNEAELENWANEFSAAGHHIVADPQEAELTVLNTCAVTSEAVRKSRKLINRTRRENPRGKIVVSGCFVSLPQTADSASQRNLSAELGIDMIVENDAKDKLVELVNRRWQIPLMPLGATEPSEYSLFARNRHRAFIKIQDGCRYRCSYCIVTVARGAERSRTPSDLISQINELCEQGVKEVVLTGVHVGGYGSDINNDLKTLVKTLLAETSIPRLRFASVEPWDLGNGFFELFENPRLMPHMHLPMQSGSNSVLRRMSRRCRTEDFLDLIEQSRRIDDFHITTDIIVGFPGETEEEWQQTLEFVEQINVPHVHIFAFSARQGTKAATLENPISPTVKSERSRQLHELSARLKRQHLQNMVGQTANVLWEKSEHLNGTTCLTGYTPNYQRVAMPVDNLSAINSITLCQITDIDSQAQLGLASAL